MRPRNPYAASKAGAELLCRAYAVTYGLPVTIVRGTNAFGPRQHPEKAIPTWTTAALEGRPIPVYGDGRQSAGVALRAATSCAAIASCSTTARPGTSTTSATGTS